MIVLLERSELSVCVYVRLRVWVSVCMAWTSRYKRITPGLYQCVCVCVSVVAFRTRAKV